MDKKVVAFVPVRGGSKGIPLKNIKPFCGKPLVYWVLSAASECPLITRIYVSTDSTDIARTVDSLGFEKVEVVHRGEETASDMASTESAMSEFIPSVPDFGHIVLIQATSPLLTTIDLTKGLEKYFEQGFDSLLSVVRQKRFIWKDDLQGAQPENYDVFRRPRRQDWEGFLVENGAFYITSKTAFLKTGSRLSGKTGTYEMADYTYFEIDSHEDWWISEGLKYRQLKAIAQEKKTKINLLVCDVDGVLTDAGMYYSTQGAELKKFNTRDGMGISLLRKTGVSVMFLTSEENDTIRNRAKKLQIEYLFMGATDKLSTLQEFFHQHPEYSFETTAYVGDDLNDLECMRRTRISYAPADAHSAVKNDADIVCNTNGGEGCVREVCELLMYNLV